jgi:ribonuclease-3
MDAVQDLPYNINNVLVDIDDIENLLKRYLPNGCVNNINVYRQAFVHRSYCTRKNENFINGNFQCPENCLPLQEESNERLEFLGDAVINLVVGKYLFNRYPDENEGFMTKIRTKLVNGTMLAHFATIIMIEKYVLISKQIEENDGRSNKKILEDAFEAFIGAMINDLNSYSLVEEWIINMIEDNIDFSELIRKNSNYKDMLIKHFQYNHNMCPKYFEMSVDTKSCGTKIYNVCIKGIDDALLGIGSGTSKKNAENNASHIVLKSLGIVVD